MDHNPAAKHSYAGPSRASQSSAKQGMQQPSGAMLCCAMQSKVFTNHQKLAWLRGPVRREAQQCRAGRRNAARSKVFQINKARRCKALPVNALRGKATQSSQVPSGPTLCAVRHGTANLGKAFSRRSARRCTAVHCGAQRRSARFFSLGVSDGTN